MKYPSEPRWLIETLADADGWKSFVVMVLHAGERRHYHLAHNGQRFARQSGFQSFCDDFPLVAEEVASWAEAV